MQHGWGTLLIIHIHFFWVTPLISHHSQWQLHVWNISNSSVPGIWAFNFHKLEKKNDYCNLGTVSILSFRIPTSLYLTVTAQIQRWYRNGFPILDPKASHELQETPANLEMVLFSAWLHTSAECAVLLLGDCLLPQPTYQSGLAYRRENYSKKQLLSTMSLLTRADTIAY